MDGSEKEEYNSEGVTASDDLALEQSEDSVVTEPEYNMVFETIEDAVFVFDVDHDGDEISFSFRQNNAAHEELTDITVDEFSNESPKEILGANEGEEVAAKYRRCVKAEETIEYEETIDHPTGTVEWHTKLTPVFEDGGVTRIVGIARDITERKKRERELTQKRERLRALFDEAPDGIVIHDADGQVIDVNETICEQLGYTRNELLSMDVFDFDVSLDETAIRSEWESMDPGSMQRIEVEGLHRRKDGSTFPVEVWVSKVRSSNEEPARFVALIRDITERKEYEREREQRETKYRNLFEESRDALMLLDREGFFDCNKATLELFGFDSVDVFTDYTSSELSPSTQPDGANSEAAAKKQIERAFEDGIASFEWTHKRTDGTEFDAEVKLSRFEIDGKPALHSIVRDITERKQRERQLQRHETYLESANDIITLIEPDGTIEYISSAVERILGFEPDELIGKNGFEYVHPEDRESRLEDIESLADSPKEEAVLEFRFQRADGSYRWIESTVRNLLDDPDVERLLLSSRDITERKQYERRLSTLHDATRRVINAESKQEVAEITVDAAQDLLDFSLPSVWYPTGDRTKLTLVANSAEHQMLLEEANTPNPTHTADSWLWDVIESDETVVRSPIPNEDLAADVPLQSAIILPLGEYGILGCGVKGEVEFSDRDIRIAEILARNVRTALDQLDQRAALERQKTFTDDLLDAIEDVVYVLDTNGDFKEWNMALEELTGYSSEEIDSMNATDFFSEGDAESVEAAVEEAFKTGRTRVELDFLTADGESIPYEFIANTFEDPTGESVMAGIGRDRSIHVEYEETLEEQRDNLSVLNQVVRHDIRNDMTVVKGRANLLDEHIDAEGRDDLEAVLDATEDAIELTRTARDLSETMLSTEGDVESVGLEQYLMPSIENARSKFDHAVITIENRVPDVTVPGNELLEAVFRNLIQNAVVHNDKEAPSVEVSTNVNDNLITVSVTDNGPGISDDQKETIFGKGEKGLGSPGTGIGLYLVRTLVDRYGGNVWVEDSEPEGSVFYVKLPRTDTETNQ